jgi:hypothetical protein
MSEPAYRVTGIEIGGEFIPIEDVPKLSITWLDDALHGPGVFSVEVTGPFRRGPGWYQMLRKFGLIHARRDKGWWRGRKMSEGMRRRGL